jgi:hypothetical protein
MQHICKIVLNYMASKVLEKALTTLAEQVKELATASKQQHDKTIQAMTTQLTVLNKISNSLTDQQRMLIATSNKTNGTDKKESAADITKLIKEHKISKSGWTPHLEKANTYLTWTNLSDRYTTAVLIIGAEDGEVDLLRWLLVFFAGECQEEDIECIEEPVWGLIESTSQFQQEWLSIIELSSAGLTDSIINQITERMFGYAIDRYNGQSNTKKLATEPSQKDKHGAIPAFMKKYIKIFRIWTKQLLLYQEERIKYVENLPKRKFSCFLILLLAVMEESE